MADQNVPDDYAKAIQKAADATARLQSQLESQSFRQQARQLAASRMEYERTVSALQRINQQEAIRARQLEVQRRFGRLAGSLYGTGAAIGGSPFAQGAWGVAQTGAMYARGMASQGASGTVEAARMGTELTMLGREFAGVAKPFTDGLEKLTRSVRRAMESMDGDQQNRMLYAVGGVMAAGLAMRYRGAIGAGVRGVAGLAGLGGAGGGITRAIGRAGPIGAILGLGISSAGFGSQSADQTNPYTKTFAEENPDMARQLDGMSNEQMRDYWNKTKGEGKPNMGLAALSTIGKSARNAGAWLLNQIPIGERIKYMDEYSNYDQLKREIQRRGAIGGREGRSAVTLAGGGFEEAGSGFMRLQSAFGAMQNANNQDGGGDGGILGRIADAVDRIAGKTEVK